ncbi:MAG: PCYCGC motif-containing (lipo)protein [Candidatus Hodarchaeales archaeon]|jgi:hypothetical protein
MSKRKRKNSRSESNKPVDSGRKGTIALLLLIGAVAIMVWATLGLGKQSTEVKDDVQLPAYAYVSARSEQSYRVAIDPIIQNGDVLSKIPCYCGCGGIGHSSLKDCFLDEHGSFCDICQYEALETYEMVKKGVPVAEIRSIIDNRYGGGRFAEGTETPPVA